MPNSCKILNAKRIKFKSSSCLFIELLNKYRQNVAVAAENPAVERNKSSIVIHRRSGAQPLPALLHHPVVTMPVSSSVRLSGCSWKCMQHYISRGDQQRQMIINYKIHSTRQSGTERRWRRRKRFIIHPAAVCTKYYLHYPTTGETETETRGEE